MATEDETRATAESELRAADLEDSIADLDRKRLRIVWLSAIAFLTLMWIGLEATALGAMALSFLAIHPLKRAIREYYALSSRRTELIGASEPEEPPN